MMPKLICLIIVSLGIINSNYAQLDLKFQWNFVEFNYESEELRAQDLQSRRLIRENVLPLGIEVFENRVFLTFPRWKAGIPVSFGYIYMNDTKENPVVNPYPNWEFHKKNKIVSPFRVKIDRCNRLWIMDMAVDNLLNVGGKTKAYPPKLLIFNLKNDQLIREFVFPKDTFKENNFFGGITVDDEDCEDAYGYFSDLTGAAINIYSWKLNKMWRKTNLYFHPDPFAGDYFFNELNYTWFDGIFSLGLGPKLENGDKLIYTHCLTGFHEFSVSTNLLKKQSLEPITDLNYHDVRVIGTRGKYGQAGAAVVHQGHKVLFYPLLNYKSVECWNINKEFTPENRGKIAESNVTLEFVNDVKIDQNNNLWVLSDNIPNYFEKTFSENDLNFFISSGNVDELIKGTPCE